MEGRGAVALVFGPKPVEGSAVRATKFDAQALLLVTASASAVALVVSLAVGAVVFHHAQVRARDAAAAVQVAMRSTVADHPFRGRATTAVEVSVATVLPDVIELPDVTVGAAPDASEARAAASKVALQGRKPRPRTTLWSSIKRFFSKHA